MFSCVSCSPLMKLQHHGGVLKESEVGKLQFVVLHHLDKITRPSLKQTRGRGGVNLTIELSLAYRDVSSFSKSPDKVVFSSNRWYFKELLTNFTPRKTASLYDMSTFIIWLIHPNYLLVFILICSKTFWFFSVSCSCSETGCSITFKMSSLNKYKSQMYHFKHS